MEIFDNLSPAIIKNQQSAAAQAFAKANGHYAFVVGPTYVTGKTQSARHLLRDVAGGQPVRRAFACAFFDHCREEGFAPSPRQDREDPKAVFVTLNLTQRNG